MGRSRFTDEQIAEILNEHEAGKPVTEVCRAHHITDTTFYNWRKRMRPVAPVSPTPLAASESEVTLLRERVADLLAEVSDLRDIIAKHVP